MQLEEDYSSKCQSLKQEFTWFVGEAARRPVCLEECLKRVRWENVRM